MMLKSNSATIVWSRWKMACALLTAMTVRMTKEGIVSAMKIPKWLYQWKLIMGCDARGDGDSVFMIRRTLLGFINMHTFLRSDSEEHHDHPWHFVSIILWRGYLEETGIVTCPYCLANPGCIPSHPPEVSRKRVYPGMVLFRRAIHRHRVVLVDGKKAITLMIRGPRVREWGFFTSKGWQHWVRYFKEKGC
jgi:uncharacterized Zn-finger protein